MKAGKLDKAARNQGIPEAALRLFAVLAALLAIGVALGAGIVSAAPYVATMPGTGPAGALVFADGVDAADGNPAVLGLRFRWEVRPLSVGAGLGNSFFDYSVLNTDYTQGDLQEKLTATLIERGGVSLDTGAQAAAGIAIGPVALSVSPVVFGGARLSGGLADFLINGNLPGKDYVLDGTSLNALAAASANLGVGFPVARNVQAGPIRLNVVSLGGAFHYYKAAFFVKGGMNGTLSTDGNGNTTASGPGGQPVGEIVYAPGSLISIGFPQFSGFGGGGGTSGGFGAAGILPNPLPSIGGGGTGLGGDVGLAAVVNDRIRVGVAVRNLGTTITWESAKRMIVDSVSVTGGPSGPSFDAKTSPAEDIANYKTPIPAELVAGVSATVLPATEVFVEGNKGFGDGFGVSRQPRLRAGLSWAPFNVIKLGAAGGYQAGINGFGGGVWDWTAGAGLTLGFINVHVGAGGLGGFKPEQWKGARVGVSLSLGW